jgi:hypothetical protein
LAQVTDSGDGMCTPTAQVVQKNDADFCPQAAKAAFSPPMQDDPKSHSSSTPAPKAKSTLAKLEREIAGVADRLRGGVDRAQARMKSGPPGAKTAKAVKQKLTFIIASVFDSSVASYFDSRSIVDRAESTAKQP